MSIVELFSSSTITTNNEIKQLNVCDQGLYLLVVGLQRGSLHARIQAQKAAPLWRVKYTVVSCSESYGFCLGRSHVTSAQILLAKRSHMAKLVTSGSGMCKHPSGRGNEYLLQHHNHC